MPRVCLQFVNLVFPDHTHYCFNNIVGYNMDVVRHSACLVIMVIKPVTVYTYGFLFHSTAVGQDSDSMTVLT